MFLTICCAMIGLTIIAILDLITNFNPAHLIVWLIMWSVILIVNSGLSYWILPTLTVTNVLALNVIGLIIGYFGVNVLGDDDDDEFFNSSSIWIIGSLIVTVLVLFGIHINTNVHVKESYNTINLKTMHNAVAPTLKRGETPVAIAPATVFNKIKKDMSDVPNANAYQIGSSNGHNEIQAQFEHGKPVYIVPLQFRGLSQAFNNHNVIPGYFKISATDPNAEPVFVKSLIRYGNHQYLGHNVDRLIYRTDPTLADLSATAQLEIDDHQVPYYVKTLFVPDRFSNRKNYQKLKVAVVNAQTGVLKFYDPQRTPKFIDENLTSDAADDLNHDFGYNVHGWLNHYWGQTDLKQPTENGPEDGVTTVFNANGTISYLTDFTSTTSSTNSALGYSMINARTGQLTYYATKGIMDTDGAIDNADRNYHAQNYHAEMPVLYSIDGHATWVMSVLDSSGLQRGFYYVDGANPSLHADGDSITATLDAFRQVLVNSGGTVKNTTANKPVNHTGTITRCFVTAKGTALFTLNGQSTIYYVDTTNYQSANLIRPGDKVSFATGGNGTKNTVTNFVDHNLK